MIENSLKRPSNIPCTLNLELGNHIYDVLFPIRWVLPTFQTLFKGRDMVMTLSHMDHAKMGLKESKPMSSCLGRVTMSRLSSSSTMQSCWKKVKLRKGPLTKI